MSDFEFRHRLRVRYAETDTGGVAHHSSYVAWFEEARTEWMRARGKTYRQVETDGVFLLVAEMRVQYMSPSTYDDELEIALRVAERRRASIDIEYDVTRVEDGRLIARAMTRLAATDGSGRLCRLPAGV